MRRGLLNASYRVGAATVDTAADSQQYAG